MISRRILAAIAFLCLIAPAQAQKTKSVVISEINANFPDQTTGAITPAIARTTFTDFVNSWQQYAGVNAQVGTTYTVQLSDYGQLVTFNNGGAIAVTLPQAASTFSTFNFFAGNLGTGTVTITPQGGSTINGTPSLTLTTGQSAYIVSDGTNYQIVRAGLNASQFSAGNCISITGTITPTIAVAGSGCIQTAQLSNNAVTNAILAQMSANGLKGNNTGGASNVLDLTPGQVGAILCTPIRTVLTSGTNVTFTTPTCNGVTATRLEWELEGGGGGGAGSGTTPGAATAGTATCVNTSGTACTSSLFQANGGAPGQAANGVNSAGGTTSGCDLGIVGGIGSGAANIANGTGGAGGASYFGGQAPANSSNGAATAGGAAAANSGGGGAGASSAATVGAGGGGAAGGYCRKTQASPAASYVFTNGANGSGGTLGTSGAAGGNGGTGLGVVTAYWQ